MTNTDSPSINAEIVSAPAVSNMTVTPVGRNMFSLNLNLVLVVRFPGLGASAEQNQLLVSTAVQPISTDTPVSSSEPIYANGEKPEAGGETSAFNDFAYIHSYPPPSRQVLLDWVQSQQQP
jgi:hypothetical protein